jgi:hypothetical protein
VEELVNGQREEEHDEVEHRALEIVVERQRKSSFGEGVL